jgi:hypothetical protein
VATGDPEPAILPVYYPDGEPKQQCSDQCWVLVTKQGEGYAQCLREQGHDGRHLYGFALELEPQ